jgi:hypothetical protein
VKAKKWVGPVRLHDGDIISRSRNFEFETVGPLPDAYVNAGIKARKHGGR